jgi:hypothetical protein
MGRKPLRQTLHQQALIRLAASRRATFSAMREKEAARVLEKPSAYQTILRAVV